MKAAILSVLLAVTLAVSHASQVKLDLRDSKTLAWLKKGLPVKLHKYDSLQVYVPEDASY